MMIQCKTAQQKEVWGSNFINTRCKAGTFLFTCSVSRKYWAAEVHHPVARHFIWCWLKCFLGFDGLFSAVFWKPPSDRGGGGGSWRLAAVVLRQRTSSGEGSLRSSQDIKYGLTTSINCQCTLKEEQITVVRHLLMASSCRAWQRRLAGFRFERAAGWS